MKGSGVPTFLERTFRGTPPAIGDKIIGDDFMEIVLAGGYPDALSRRNGKPRLSWFCSYLDALIEHEVRAIATVERVGQLCGLIDVLAQY